MGIEAKSGLASRVHLALEKHPDASPAEIGRIVGASSDYVRATLNRARKSKGMAPRPKAAGNS